MNKRPGTNRIKGLTQRYGEDKANTKLRSRNYAAELEQRPLHKLRELLCIDGDFTQGKACETCKAACHFGKEYLARIQEINRRESESEEQKHEA